MLTNTILKTNINNHHLRSLFRSHNVHHVFTHTTTAPLSYFAPPRIFDYPTITSNISIQDAIPAIEEAFSALANDEVDVPLPMHICIDESKNCGPGHCHIKGGYVSAATTFTVKLATVGFIKNADKNLPLGSGLFLVNDAVTGAPLAVLQENRFLTDLRTGAAGAVAMKYCSKPTQDLVGFIGCGAIARSMARAACSIRHVQKCQAYAIDIEMAKRFCRDMRQELNVPFEVCSTAEQICKESNVIFTQTPGASTVIKKEWVFPTTSSDGITIISSGSDQPSKQELPTDLLEISKYVADSTKQTVLLGELRSALEAGVMKEEDVYAELGDIVNGVKVGREGNEVIVVDLTGTGAQDAAIGQVAWDKLRNL